MIPVHSDESKPIEERIKAWRAHPNYHKSCACGHPSVLHDSGEGRCFAKIVGKTVYRCRCKHFTVK